MSTHDERLIAELVAALRGCLKALDVAFDRSDGDLFGAHHNDATDAMLAAAAAIAKATGDTL